MLSTYRLVISCRITGPQVSPTEMGEGKWAVIGGGVGLAIAFPVARQLVAAGRGSRNHGRSASKELLLLEDQFRSILDDDHIHAIYRWRFMARKGVAAPLERLLGQAGQPRILRWPSSMMKFSTPHCWKFLTHY